MSNFRLPCDCGQSVSVSVSQAGQTVRCSCGAQLEVPTLRGLQKLAPADATSIVKRRAAWENRQRVIFSLVLISFCALALGAYLWANVPSVPRPATPEEIKSIFAAGKPDQVYDAFQNLQQGLGRPARAIVEGQRDFMAIGIEVALGIGICGLIAAVAMALTGRKRAV
jgi:hypothetical protein